MDNFEKEFVEFINTLEPEMRDQIVEWVEWEKELSWSAGYADASDYFESKEN
jgi:hypothetical protein